MPDIKESIGFILFTIGLALAGVLGAFGSSCQTDILNGMHGIIHVFKDD